MQIKERRMPYLLALIVGKDTSMALKPYIFWPYNADGFEPLAKEHEVFHIISQIIAGLGPWLKRYAFDKRFRFEEECKATVKSVIKLNLPESEAWDEINRMAYELPRHPYNCPVTFEEGLAFMAQLYINSKAPNAQA